METRTQAPAAGQKLRAVVWALMTALKVPEETPSGTPPVAREDGVLEFYKYWLVRGAGSGMGLYATYSDNDDVIEFGLSDRHGNMVQNVLQATLVLDETGGELNVLSETRSNLNFDAVVTPDDFSALAAALHYFSEVVEGK